MAAKKTVSGLFGRAAELQGLGHRVAGAETGRLEAVFIEGEAGIGKTRLLTETLASAEESGFHVFLGRCDEIEAARPFGPIADALGCTKDAPDARRAEIGTALLEHGSSDGGAAHFRIIEAFGDLVEAAAIEGPVAIAVEDLHWADASTLATLRSLAKRLTFLPVFLAGTLRPLPRRDELESLLAILEREGAFRLPLTPLGEEAVTDLVSHTLEADPSEDLMRVVEGAAGNPLFVRELLDALRLEEAITTTGGRADVRDATLPPDLRLTILRRISFLSREALQILRLAAVLGTTFSPTDLAAVADRPVAEMVPVIDELSRAGLVTESGGALRFRHDLIREALYEDIPEGVRRALHLEAARSLSRAGGSEAEVAEHFARGASPGDVEATRALRDAAGTNAISPLRRVELLRRAAEFVPPDHADRDPTLADLAEALIWAGGPEEGGPVARDVHARHARDAHGRRVRLAVARALWVEARWVDLVGFADQWLPEGHLDEAERGMLLAHRSFARLHSGWPPDAAAEDGAEALAIGERIRDDAVTVFALMALAFARNYQGRAVEGVSLEGRAVKLAERNPDPEVQRLHPHIFLGLGLHVLGRFDEAEEVFKRGARVREQLGSLWDLPLHLATMAVVHYRGGDWSDAIAEAEASIASGEEIGTHVGREVAHIILGNTALYRGDLEVAEGHVAQAEAIVARRGPQWGDPRGLRVRLLAARGDTVGALQLLRDSASWVGQNQALFLLDSVPVALEAGDRSLAEEVVKRAEESCRRTDNPVLIAFSLGGRGLLEDDHDTLLEAVAAFRPTRWWEGAIAQEHAAGSLARHARMDEATPLFREALDAYDRLGARRLSARTLATMRGFGLRAGARGPRKRPSHGWEALTDTERQVVKLASQGLTNPEIGERLFISRHTVRTHLSHVFTKLGISSRVELAAEVARNEEPPDADTASH